jgi:hypothetical protein
VKSEPKAFASLSSGLLARKGAARPAMRPQGFGQIGANLEDLGWNDMGFEPPKPVTPIRDAEHDAFGSDLNGDAPRHATGLTPLQSPVHSQQAEIADRFGGSDQADDEAVDDTAELYQPEEEPAQPVQAARPVAPAVAAVVPVPAPRRAPKPRSAPGSKGKAAFTLRLDPDRHLKLRLACAVSGRSAQLLVTDALDQLLGAMPELEVMAAKATAKG